MSGRTIASSVDTVFEFEYGVQAQDLRGLYEKAKRDQWDASRDVAWDTPEPDDGRLLADELVEEGSPLLERLSEKERVELNRRLTAWRLGVLMYGEHGAMLACSQLVDVVSGIDQKLFQATQVADEARHNEVLERYLATRLGDLRYPMPENVRSLFDVILSDGRWYIKTIALQLVAETFAVSLFKMMAQTARDPLLTDICRRILQDESRHMGFGMLALPAVVREASASERREMEEIACESIERVLVGNLADGPYRDLGFSDAEIAEVAAHRRAAARDDRSLFRSRFRRDMHGAMVLNLQRLGLLGDRVRPRLAKLGVELPAAAAP